MSGYLKMCHGALDTEDGCKVLRGRIDPATLDMLLVDDYQREILPSSTIEQIMEGFEQADGSVPDIYLGMRGEQFHRCDNGSFVLRDPVYIIDGLQRVTAAKLFRERGGSPILGAGVYFNSNREWEIERFKRLNASRTKLSPNVLLRNTRSKCAGMELVYEMCLEDAQFVLKDRVCWQQRKQRSHLLTAMTMLRSICQLHAHLATGLQSVTTVDDVPKAMQKLYDLLGRSALRDNVRAFFQLVDDCWHVRSVTFTESAAHLRFTFLLTLARVLDNHERFWREKRLLVEMELMRKFKTFPVSDPTVQQLSGASGQAIKYLYNLMVDHLNRGKRTKRLKERRATAEPVGISDEPIATNGEAEADV